VGSNLCNVHNSEYGQKIHLASPYQAKDAVKSLDWESTHRSWDDDAGMWSMDINAVGRASVAIHNAGFSVAATQGVGETLEAVVS